MQRRTLVLSAVLAGAVALGTGAAVFAASGGGPGSSAGGPTGTQVLMLVDSHGVTTTVGNITGYTFGAENSGSGTGGTRFQTLVVKRAAGGGSVPLYKGVVQGTQYAAANLVVPDSSGGDLTFQFSHISATRIAWMGTAGQAPVETIDFTYGALQLTYTGGGPPGATSFAWDVRTQKPGL